MENSVFLQAAELNNEKWVSSLPEDSDLPEVEYSEEHNKKIKELLNSLTPKS